MFGKRKPSWEFWESPSKRPSKQEVIEFCRFQAALARFFSAEERFSLVNLALSVILQPWGDFSFSPRASSCSLLIKIAANNVNLFSRAVERELRVHADQSEVRVLFKVFVCFIFQDLFVTFKRALGS